MNMLRLFITGVAIGCEKRIKGILINRIEDDQLFLWIKKD